MKRVKKISIFALLLCLIVSSFTNIFASIAVDIDATLADTANYLIKTVKKPQVGSIGGEWAVLGLARSNVDVPKDYFEAYYNNVVEHVKGCKGILHAKKYTEYSRIILALTAIGKDPTDVGGYNLLEKLGDFEKTKWQGINGSIFALLALDSGNYQIPKCSEAVTQATRDMYIDEILDKQLVDGGFALTGSKADPDVTGMALQALAKYQSKKDVKVAIEYAVACLSNLQNEDGGYSSFGVKNSESVVQVITALCELGISIEDERFIKNNNTLVDNLMTYYKKGNGFLHTADGSGANGMSTEQAFYGLVSIQRLKNSQNSLYNMTDVKKSAASNQNNNKNGLANKDKAVNITCITKPNISFSDTTSHINKKAIEALAQREIINGVNKDSFSPDKTMNRAEFATIITKALGLKLVSATNQFIDVNSSKWYARYIATAYKYQIINGKSNKYFDPSGTITREEACAMVARASKLCGLETDMSEVEIRDMLAQFGDYQKVSSWAKPSTAFCYKSGILSQDEFEILPSSKIKRCEIAQILYNMLQAAKLL